MAQLTIRNLDDKTYKQLKENAVVNQRSLEAEARVALADSVDRQAQRREAIAWTRRLRDSLPASDFDVVAAIREDRDHDRLSRIFDKKSAKRKTARKPRRA